MIYLDHNSSTYVLPHVYDLLSTRNIEFLGNADSPHAAGRAAKSIIDDARSSVAVLAGTRSGNVIFTSGATESNALALASYISNGCTIFASAVEHKSVLKYADVIIPVDPEGHLSLVALRERLYAHRWNRGIVVACMYANNETGVILDCDDAVVNVCMESGAKLHIDASQCYSKGGRLTKLQKEYASTITLSGHKMHAMKGVGSLIFRDEILNVLKPQMLGGSQELGLRSGTRNAEAIFSFGVAATEAINNSAVAHSQMALQISEIENELSDISTINGTTKHRLCNTTNLHFPKIKDLQIFIESLSELGLMVSGTSACDSGMTAKSHVLSAMFGDDSERVSGSIRISVSPKTTWQEVLDAIKIIRKVVVTT